MTAPSVEADPLPQGWREAELQWEALQEKAAIAWRAGTSETAIQAWAEALALAERTFEPHDPRFAASLANHGAGLIAAGEKAAGSALLLRACGAWDEGAAWVEAIPPDRRARSSLFHLRLETRHPGGYAEAAKRRHRALAAEGRAALEALRAGAPAPDRLPLWLKVKRRGHPPLRRLQAACWLLAPGGAQG